MMLDRPYDFHDVDPSTRAQLLELLQQAAEREIDIKDLDEIDLQYALEQHDRECGIL